MTKHISQKRLKELLHYGPDTGIFARLSVKSPGARMGVINNAPVCRGYNRICVDGVRILSHRLAFIYMTGTCPDQVDHIDRNRLNNKWDNLRSADYVINSRNTKVYKTNKTGINGVRRRGSGWQVQIGGGRRKVYLGQFPDFLSACCARKSAEVALW